MLFCLRRPSLYIYIYKNIMNKWTLLALVATSFTAQAQQLPNANFNGKWVDCIPSLAAMKQEKFKVHNPKVGLSQTLTAIKVLVPLS